MQYRGETLLPERLDGQSLKAIIVGISAKEITKDNAKLKIITSFVLLQKNSMVPFVKLQCWRIVYFPFKRCLNLIRIAGKDFIRQLLNRSYLQNQWKQFYDTSYVKPAAQSFIDILYKSHINFRKTKVLVIDINRYPLFDHHFQETALTIIQNFGCFYPLDNHLTVHGHQLLANEIIDKIKKSIIPSNSSKIAQ